MKLKKLIKGLDITIGKGGKDIPIHGVTSHSKSVGPGYLFIARRGESFDGNDFIPDAILAGASCVLTDIYNPFLENVVQLISTDIAKVEPIIASRFYDHPSSKLFTIGVTGTNGKTTTATMIWHLLNQVELTGMMTTIERRIGEYAVDSQLTTPDSCSCQKMLHEMEMRGGKSVVMEVSSHSLVQARVEEIFFDCALFMNLSRDHLDYHQTMIAYRDAKGLLFSKIKEGGVAIINGDDAESSYFREQSEGEVITFGLTEKCDFQASDIALSEIGTKFTLHHGDETVHLELPLLGTHNVYNALAAAVVGRRRGLSWELIDKGLREMPQVQGRMEKVSEDTPYSVFVDFAHTPEALSSSIQVLKEITQGRVIVVFGGGGGRDQGKRPEMAKAVEAQADEVIVTSDNPRHEDPMEIIEQIVSGFTKCEPIVEVNRREAIRKAISLVREGDFVLIAGKGHEKTQVIEGKTIEFDDVKVAKEILDVLV